MSDVKSTMRILNDRERIENIKNEGEGITEVDKIKKFKKKIGECLEIELFIVIDHLGYMIWRTEHDLADGRIEYPEWDKNDKFFVQAEIELAVEQTKRFGVEPFEVDTTKPTLSYRKWYKWYKWWKDYIEGKSQEEWQTISELISENKDCSMYRPEGD